MSAFNRYDEPRDTMALTNGGASQRRSPTNPPAAQRGNKAAPSLLDRRQPYYSGIQRFGLAKLSLYFSDPFHTALNLPWWKFILLFFSTYFIEFFFFSLLYYSQPHRCIPGISQFSHALWISSRVASTIGFNDPLVPNPKCAGTNLLVMANVICSSLIDFIMLGLVFARFSAPFKRATTIRFSDTAVVHRHSSGFWCISFRIANIRKHQVLSPEVKLMLTAVDSITPADYVFEYLEPHDVHRDTANLQLGFPANVTHLIKPGTPLWGLSLQEMESRLMEVLVFVDCIDSMTAKHMQARKAYYSSDIVMNAALLPMHLTRRNGKVGMDFTEFDAILPAADDLPPAHAADASADLRAVYPDLTAHHAHLRHLTFKRLAEQATGKPAAPRTTSAAPSAAAPVANPFQGGTGSGKDTVELVPITPTAADAAAAGGRDQAPAGAGAAAAVTLQLHAVCDAVLADSSSSAALRNQATAAKARYPLAHAPEASPGRFESVHL